MLRAWFVLGAIVICGVGIAYRYIPVVPIFSRTGTDVVAIASTIFFVVLLLVWVAGMIGITAYRLVRFFAKPSY